MLRIGKNLDPYVIGRCTHMQVLLFRLDLPTIHQRFGTDFI